MTNVDAVRTLLLTQGYEPIQIISWQRAVTLVALDKVDVVEAYDTQIRAASLVIDVPAVVRLRKAFRRHAKPVKFSRVNIYARDGYRCQYCGERCPTDELTYDHVVPRAQGGRTTWDNIVTACYACNRRKANRTPAEASMKLLSTPTRPTWMPAVQIRVSARSVPDAWRDYVYWTGEIDSEEGGGVDRDRGGGAHGNQARRRRISGCEEVRRAASRDARSARRCRFVEGERIRRARGGGMVPLAGGSWSQVVSASPKLVGRVGGIGRELGMALSLDWTPLHLRVDPLDSNPVVGHRCRLLGSFVIHRPLTGTIHIEGHAGAGVDYASYHFSNGYGSSTAGPAFEVGGGLWFATP